MARALREEYVTPSDELRHGLADAEKLVASLRGLGAGALDILLKMDRIAQLWPELEALGVDLRPEAGRWESLQSMVHKHAGSLVREVGAVGGLPAAREKFHPGEQAGWWWYLAEETRASSLRSLRRTGIVLLGVLALVALAVFLFNRFLPIDPRVREAASRQLAGQQKIMNQSDYQGALADFRAAADLTPDDPEAWLWLGATQQRLGGWDTAGESFRRARGISGSDKNFFLSRVGVYFSLKMDAEARSDAEAVLAMDPENAQAHFYMAGVFENDGQYAQAIAELQQAANLAEKGDQPQLSAMARYRMAMLIQQVQAGSLAFPTPAPP